jgi:hypothetical protein
MLVESEVHNKQKGKQTIARLMMILSLAELLLWPKQARTNPSLFNSRQIRQGRLLEECPFEAVWERAKRQMRNVDKRKGSDFAEQIDCAAAPTAISEPVSGLIG